MTVPPFGEDVPESPDRHFAGQGRKSVVVTPVALAIGFAVATGIIGAVARDIGPALTCAAIGGLSLSVMTLVSRDGEYLPRGAPLESWEIVTLIGLPIIMGLGLVAVVVDAVLRHGHVASGFLAVVAGAAVLDGLFGVYAWERRPPRTRDRP